MVERSDRSPDRSSAPREFGRDGISGMVTRDRAIRAREVCQPGTADIEHAEQVVEALIARARGISGSGRSQ